VADSGRPAFSKSGRRLVFFTRPRPDEEEEKENGSEEGSEEDDEDGDDDELPPVKLDVWHWKDPLLQPMQLVQAQRERNRSFQAIVHLEDGRIVQLADEDVPEVSLAEQGDVDVGLGSSDAKYRKLISWDYPGFQDLYLVDLRTGQRELALEKVRGRASLSPQGKYITWFDFEDRHWHAMSVKTRNTVNLTELVPHPLYDELHDEPSPAGSYGSAGWVENDVAFIVYDRYDVWMTNPSGFFPPSCITDGWGREHGVRLRRVRLDPDEDAIDPDAPMMLSAFDVRTKASGFARDLVRGTTPPEVLVMKDERMSTPGKARDDDALLLTRQTFEMFPDVWVADGDFSAMKRVSDANPQQSEYLWGSAQLVEWTSADGEPLQGILYTPEGFDPSKQYPMMVYFYERNSDNLHRYTAPTGSRSVINFSFYVSRGYLLFIPDIPYEIGSPGMSAMNAVMPGVASIVDRGFVDRDRIGVQGHSWGGYQIAYMVTRTDLFRCAESGAPVSNMVSAYGGIRWASGMSRMFQYEKTQSRIGGTLWNSQQYYIENSPVFWADRIETPLLILHNDEDGAVPWYQGIELFVALRRLGKPAWMLNYNGEAHGLRKEENMRDFAGRMQQFFDHYLKDAPAPVWLAEGVPAVEKGKTLGLETATSDRRD
jgi:dienelactone hydrolase